MLLWEALRGCALGCAEAGESFLQTSPCPFFLTPVERIGCGGSRIRDWDLWEAVLALLGIVKRKWEVEVLFWWVPPDCKSIDPRRLHSSDLFRES